MRALWLESEWTRTFGPTLSFHSSVSQQTGASALAVSTPLYKVHGYTMFSPQVAFICSTGETSSSPGKW